MLAQFLSIVIFAAFVTAAIFVSALRKTIGLLLVILGGIACLTFFGAIIGIPTILIGGLLLFI